MNQHAESARGEAAGDAARQVASCAMRAKGVGRGVAFVPSEGARITYFDAGDAVRLDRGVLEELDRPRGLEVVKELHEGIALRERTEDPKFKFRLDAGTPSQIASHL